MNTGRQRLFGSGFILAMMLATFAAFAQEAGDGDATGPAVDTSALLDAERDAIEPGVDTSPVLAREATRSGTGNQVMDSMELSRTEITGNQELPKVLYIVPWQKSDPGDLMGRPVNTLLDEILAPLDREEFLRQVDYHSDLYGDEDE